MPKEATSSLTGELGPRESFQDLDLTVQQFWCAQGCVVLHANTDILLAHFKDAEGECKALLDKGSGGDKHLLALPAYDQCIKASHLFNLLDARGVISVTERQSYILRVRELAKACCGAWLATEGGRG